MAMAEMEEKDEPLLAGEERLDHVPVQHNSEARNGPKLSDEQEANATDDGNEEQDQNQSEDDEDDATLLAKLTANVRDQDDLERDIGRQADQMLAEQADERDNKRLEKTLQEKE